jgi:chemotaxis protein CheD
VPAVMGGRDVTVNIGGVFATAEPTVIKTVLGSCIAVCLVDPASRVAGMNHFMLPASGTPCETPADPGRYGIHAMDLLIGAMQKAGADRRRLVAKVFGGAHVLLAPEQGASIPERNIAFIDAFMRTEGIPVASSDVGGYLPRRIHLHSDTGVVYVKRLGTTALRQARVEERTHLTVMHGQAVRSGGITMFDADDGASP